MNDVLRQRLMRKIEVLPDDKAYQILDYIEFLESKYAPGAADEPGSVVRFAERLQDQMRRRALSPATIREAMEVILAADRALSGVASAGRQLLSELEGGGSGVPERPERPERG